MKLFKLIFFCLISTLQIAVKAENGNGGNYGGSGTTEVNVIQTGESQMISETDIKNALLYCAGNGSDNNIFQKVFGPIYNKRNGLQISKEVRGGILINESRIYIKFLTHAFQESSQKKSEIVSELSILLNGIGFLGANESSSGKCLPYPKDRCLASRAFNAYNMPMISFKEVKEIPKVDPKTADIIDTMKYFKGVTVEYDESHQAESILYNNKSDKPSIYSFPSREMAECLRAKLSHL